MIESPRHELDEVIDRVAAKMVAIDGDGGVMARVMAQLPDRTATPWMLAWPAQLTAGLALVMLAFVWARPLEQPAIQRAESLVPISQLEARQGPPVVAAPVARLVETRTPEPGSRIPSVTLRPDHERSLAPVAAIEALELDGIAPAAMALDVATSIEPLVLTELALDKGDQ